MITMLVFYLFDLSRFFQEVSEPKKFTHKALFDPVQCRGRVETTFLAVEIYFCQHFQCCRLLRHHSTLQVYLFFVHFQSS